MWGRVFVFSLLVMALYLQLSEKKLLCGMEIMLVCYKVKSIFGLFDPM